MLSTAFRSPLAVKLGVAGLLGLLALCGLLYQPLPLLVPAALGFAALAIYAPRIVLLLCVGLVPLSTEVQAGGIGTDLPVEPVMLVAAGLAVVYLLRNAKTIPGAGLRHPISILLALHLTWILLTALSSVAPLYSWKYFLAKLWYVLPYYVLGGLWLSGVREVRRFVVWLAVPMAFALSYSVARHAALGFVFEEVDKAMAPFFRNHVTYAALPSITLPFVVLGAFLFPRRSYVRYGLFALSLLMLLAIQTSYTRAAYVSILAGVGFVFMMRWRLARPALLATVALVIAFSTYVVSDNNFLKFAPDYNRTITHTDFQSLIEATYKLEDISTMERVYRWVAAGYMAAERPWLGFGPGNFATEYRGYGIESFRTYISDNIEGSGVHSYYLMVLVEQGWIGLVLFVALCLVALATAERLYHRADSREERLVVMMAASSLVINLCFQLINDMIETDKCGPWFFYSLALLTATDARQRRRSQP